MAVLSAQKIKCLMLKIPVEVYCIFFLGQSYRVKVGHLDEFVALHRVDLEHDEITIFSVGFDLLSNFAHPYEWYRRV